jgi:hypothetical protein
VPVVGEFRRRSLVLVPGARRGGRVACISRGELDHYHLAMELTLVEVLDTAGRILWLLHGDVAVTASARMLSVGNNLGDEMETK